MQVTLDEALHGTTKEIEIEVSQMCETCDGTGATPGTSERTCNLCHGQGTVRAKQGMFVVERPCPSCGGRGTIVEDPCGDCQGEGRVDRVQTLSVDIPPGVDTGTRIRLSGKGEAGQRGAPAGEPRRALLGRSAARLIALDTRERPSRLHNTGRAGEISPSTSVARGTIPSSGWRRLVRCGS